MSAFDNARPIRVYDKGKFPQQAHFAIIKFSSIHVPGDERSRSAPGHGYPAHSEPVVNYEAYLVEADWIKAIQELSKPGYHSDQFVAVRVSAPAKTTIQVLVEQPCGCGPIGHKAGCSDVGGGT